MNRIAVGIDIGGTNTEFGLITREGKALFEGRLRTNDYNDAQGLCSKIHEVIQKHLLTLDGRFMIAGVGIGAPNGNYYSGTIEYAPNLQWNGVINISQIFGNTFNVPVTLTNDANAAALGEMLYGCAKDMKNFMVITLGTGLGSGIVVNGELVHGAKGFAGELGHTIISPDGRDCGCGRKGCLETYASATGIIRTAQIMLAKSARPSRLRDVETEITGKIITEAASEGDALALEILDYTASRLGFSLANTITLLDPEAIILFGGLANAGDLLIEPTRKYMNSHLLPIFQGKTELFVSSLQEKNAAILGASALVWQEIDKQPRHAPSLS